MNGCQNLLEFFSGHGLQPLKIEGHVGSHGKKKQKLAGGFKYFLFSSLPAEMIQFDEHIFQMGWFNHQPEKLGRRKVP